MSVGRKKDLEAAIAALAARQYGLVTRAQLLGLGLGADAVTHRARAGRLNRVHAGVYALGRPPVTPLERAAAAVLACGHGALLSHGPALTLWGLRDRWPPVPEVIAPRQRRRPGIVVHCCAGLGRSDQRLQLGIAVTSPARTLLDCAPELTTARLARIVADARRAGLLHPGQLADVILRCAHHPGRRRLRALIGDEHAPTRSEFEDRFAVFCTRYGLPTPLVNVIVAGREVDAYFAAERLIVELDGWAFIAIATASRTTASMTRLPCGPAWPPIASPGIASRPRRLERRSV